jgi:hypothetical protein
VLAYSGTYSSAYRGPYLVLEIALSGARKRRTLRTGLARTHCSALRTEATSADTSVPCRRSERTAVMVGVGGRSSGAPRTGTPRSTSSHAAREHVSRPKRLRRGPSRAPRGEVELDVRSGRHQDQLGHTHLYLRYVHCSVGVTAFRYWPLGHTRPPTSGTDQPGSACSSKPPRAPRESACR